MGCKSSTPLKEETIATTPVVETPKPVAVTAAVKVESSPKTAAPPAEDKEEEKTIEEKPQEAVEPEVQATTIVAAEPEPIVESEVIAEPIAIEEPVETKEEIVEKQPENFVAAPAIEEAPKKKIVRKVKKVPKTAAIANDENAMTAKTAIKAANKTEAAPKRVAFGARTTINVPAPSGKAAAAPKVMNTNKNRKHKNVEAKKVQEMTMAFQRLLTHADHLDAHLSTRNTYTNQA